MPADWRSSKARKFLEREIKTRNIPFENKKMGSKAVSEKYKSYPEMQGVESLWIPCHRLSWSLHEDDMVSAPVSTQLLVREHHS